jgi:hypothetical protein
MTKFTALLHADVQDNVRHVDDLDLSNLLAAAETSLDQYREINRRYRKPDGSLDAAGVQRLTPLRTALKAAASEFLADGGFAFTLHDSDRDQLPGVLRDLMELAGNSHPHEIDEKTLERNVGLLWEWCGIAAEVAKTEPLAKPDAKLNGNGHPHGADDWNDGSADIDVAAAKALAGSNYPAVGAIASNEELSLNEKGRRILAIHPEAAIWDSKKWADLLGVSDGRIRQLEFWKRLKAAEKKR